MNSFCTAKASLIFSTKCFSVFGYKVVKHLTSWPLNELVKLTMLWTTGPRLLGNKCHLGKESPLHCIGANKSLLKASPIVNLVIASSYRNFCFKGARTPYKSPLFLLLRYLFQSWENLTCSQKAVQFKHILLPLYTESTNNGVGLQVLTTLVTALPLKHIQNVQHGITTSTQIINTTNYIEVVLIIIIIIINE